MVLNEHGDPTIKFALLLDIDNCVKHVIALLIRIMTNTKEIAINDFKFVIGTPSKCMKESIYKYLS